MFSSSRFETSVDVSTLEHEVIIWCYMLSLLTKDVGGGEKTDSVYATCFSETLNAFDKIGL